MEVAFPIHPGLDLHGVLGVVPELEVDLAAGHGGVQAGGNIAGLVAVGGALHGLQIGPEGGEIQGGSPLAHAAAGGKHGLAVLVGRPHAVALLGLIGPAGGQIGKDLAGQQDGVVQILPGQLHVAPAAGGAPHMGGGLPQHVPVEKGVEGLGGQFRLGQGQGDPAGLPLGGPGQSGPGLLRIEFPSHHRRDHLTAHRIHMGVLDLGPDFLTDGREIRLGGRVSLGDPGGHGGLLPHGPVQKPGHPRLQGREKRPPVQHTAGAALGKDQLVPLHGPGGGQVGVVGQGGRLQHSGGGAVQKDRALVPLPAQQGPQKPKPPDRKGHHLGPGHLPDRLGGVKGKVGPGDGVSPSLTEKFHLKAGQPGRDRLAQGPDGLLLSQAPQVHPGQRGAGQQLPAGARGGAQGEITEQQGGKKGGQGNGRPPFDPLVPHARSLFLLSGHLPTSDKYVVRSGRGDPPGIS